MSNMSSSHCSKRAVGIFVKIILDFIGRQPDIVSAQLHSPPECSLQLKLEKSRNTVGENCWSFKVYATAAACGSRPSH